MSSDPDLRLGDLSPRSGAHYLAALHLYTASFPASTRKPPTSLLALFDARRYRFFGASENERLLGLAFVYTSQSPPFALLDYLATQPEARRRGVGKALFEHTAREIERTLPRAQGLLVEVDSADEKLLAWYGRLGARPIEGISYLHPALDGGSPTPMQLLWLPFGGGRVTGPADLRAVVTEVFVGCHGQGIQDAVLARVLESIG